MEILKTLIWVLNVVSAVAIIVLVLMQHGKGADAGAAFGGGSSGSLFGATGSANFMSRFTAVSAVVFFSTCLGLAYLSSGGKRELGVMEGQVNSAAPQVPGGASGEKAPASTIPE
ncbi:preprotein translocase subunit SecG [Crenobacter luteus]|uniref:Protein-export membrane protein SecG n=1 Tax=Crenobacter luteus TaxID=1452487 RepID=A0A163CPB4_9NEIS|nr:preprotein translocase subunit SecG [Crenobacter luteus]KZE32887.1 preprotein translocase subunit SecG [Crenobacter luteus]